MAVIIGPLERLVEEFSKLPGIGPKSAQRLTYHLLRSPNKDAHDLAEAILSLMEKIHLCPVCFGVTDRDLCVICQDRGRDHSKICVVEHPSDVPPLERTGKYNGVYHVIHGSINPARGMDSEKLRIKELISRLEGDVVEEVILATNPNLEGETTAMYLRRLIIPLGIRISRLARGLPFGADLEYADDVTLGQSIEERREF